MKSKSSNIDNEKTVEQLIAESDLKTKWLSLVAHDCRGLFSNIRYLLDAMAKESITPEVFVSMLPELKQIAEMNSKTIESTFTWVNAQADGFNPNIEPVLIHSLFVELSEYYSEAIAEKELSFKFIGDKSFLLNSDRFLLRFILKQLVENAIKYSNKLGVVELIVHSDSDNINITVKDSGMGMTDRRLSSIGTLNGAPYTGTMDEKGAGLSLIIVKDFVEMLGGMMSISSVEEIGTSVELIFLMNEG